MKNGGEEIYRETAAIFSEHEEDEVVRRCTERLEEETSRALAVKFPGCTVGSLDIETDGADPENVLITAVSVSLSGADRREAVKFLSELLLCDNVNVYVTGGEENGS